MEVVIRSDADTAAQLVARLIAARVRAKPDLVLGLAPGRPRVNVAVGQRVRVQNDQIYAN